MLTAKCRAPLGARAWPDTSLRLPEGAPSSWRDVLSGEDVEAQMSEDGRNVVKVCDLLRRLPVALLTNTAAGGAREEGARKTGTT